MYNLFVSYTFNNYECRVPLMAAAKWIGSRFPMHINIPINSLCIRWSSYLPNIFDSKDNESGDDLPIMFTINRQYLLVYDFYLDSGSNQSLTNSIIFFIFFKASSIPFWKTSMMVFLIESCMHPCFCIIVTCYF